MSSPILHQGLPFFNLTALPYLCPISSTIKAIEAMEISDAEKRQIFADNARRLLRLEV